MDYTKFIFPLSQSTNRICRWCGIEYIGIIICCSNECYMMWKDAGKYDPWRKYFQPPWQPYSTARTSLVIDLGSGYEKENK